MAFETVEDRHDLVAHALPDDMGTDGGHVKAVAAATGSDAFARATNPRHIAARIEHATALRPTHAFDLQGANAIESLVETLASDVHGQQHKDVACAAMAERVDEADEPAQVFVRPARITPKHGVALAGLPTQPRQPVVADHVHALATAGDAGHDKLDR